MPEPKISRRCPDCGASIRAQAFFCPQCGGKLAPPISTPTVEEAARIHDTVEEVVDPNQTMTEADVRGRVPMQPTTQRKPVIEDEELAPDQTMTEADFRDRVASQPSSGPAPARKPSRARMFAEGSKIQRVTSKARDVEDDVKQRVQKFRDISGVVIEEASYDPSLRFVLVAAALVVLFLVIALLNNLIG